MEYNAITYDTIHSNKYPPQPKLSPLPTFWNKVVQIMEMLGYTLEEKCLKDYADKNGLYKCKYEGCNKVFPTWRERNGHFRVHEVKCAYCPYVCKNREMGSHVKALHQDEFAKLKPFACDEKGCKTTCKIATLLKVHKRKHHKK
ncbi:hypothetical protein PVAND_007898 [Polypedilum vanderplanki]|uniref:C2H2-type domain-containing protein n=1 Tax=Polypedilum vanderplanki TaxID=319348 RepID=A0A9J6C988_POLVA|nr:hypothetical protein PVAND_007898 [Polypedilum vanderplanki]